MTFQHTQIPSTKQSTLPHRTYNTYNPTTTTSLYATLKAQNVASLTDFRFKKFVLFLLFFVVASVAQSQYITNTTIYIGGRGGIKYLSPLPMSFENQIKLLSLFTSPPSDY